MSLSQHYGILRVLHRRTPQDDVARSKSVLHWFPEEPYVCLLTHRKTTIGRALNNDCILLDPAVSREHACIILDEHGWHVCNLTTQNGLYVNGVAVPAGGRMPLHSLDRLSLGNTVLQFIAPAASEISLSPSASDAMHIPHEISPFPETNTSEPLPGLNECPVTLIEESSPSTEEIILGVVNGGHAVVASSRNASTGKNVASISHFLPDSTFHVSNRERIFGGFITICVALIRVLHNYRRSVLFGIFGGFFVLGVCIVLFLNNTNVWGISTLIHEKPLTLLSILSIPLIAALGTSFLVNFVDRYEREPWYLQLAAFFWGATIAIPPTVFIEQSLEFLRPILLGSSNSNLLNALFTGLNAGFTEETVKGLGLLLLFIVLRDEFDNVTDGIVYGALIGAGFAMVENILYFVGSPKTFAFLFVSRIVLGWLNHSTFTVCFGMSLGYIRYTRVRWQHIVIPLIGYLVSVNLHSLFDFVNSFANALTLDHPDNPVIVRLSIMMSVGDYLLLLMVQVLIIFILLRSLAHEEGIIREFLSSEVSSGVVYIEEYALLQRSSLRARVERSVLWRYGIQQWWCVRMLYQTEIGLAFRKWHASMGDEPRFGYLRSEESYRQRILQLRKKILTVESPV